MREVQIHKHTHKERNRIAFLAHHSMTNGSLCEYNNSSDVNETACTTVHKLKLQHTKKEENKIKWKCKYAKCSLSGPFSTWLSSRKFS